MSLPARNRVLYLVEGEATVTVGMGSMRLVANTAWQGSGACRVRAESASACLWRWELARAEDPDEEPASGGSVVSTLKLARSIDLDPSAKYLMRCDRVDFPPGGVAYTHTHQGSGIRCLLRGEFSVEAAGKKLRIRPGEAWFERGPDPVYAEASPSELTSFVRVMILPAALKGKSSIRYVRSEDQEKPKTQAYRVFLDEAIEI
ncbi:MAG: hypothetical protein HY726_10215 [Candidatus Rokubacteria bacterium]|nr:hypothetical protein [Candidatus Rokubacteria bacterium]